jgi:hypothetical protein
MHGRHDHSHHHDHGPHAHEQHGGHGPQAHHHHARAHAAPGHNRHGTSAAQWQVPHLPDGAAGAPPQPDAQDLDLVEASFVESFAKASDATSFLRMANIPFIGVDEAGRALHLMRCEVEEVTDVGSVMPLMGGTAMRYDPLPKAFVSRRRRLSFAYHDGRSLVRLSFAQARALAPASDPTPLRLASERGVE